MNKKRNVVKFIILILLVGLIFPVYASRAYESNNLKNLNYTMDTPYFEIKIDPINQNQESLKYNSISIYDNEYIENFSSYLIPQKVYFIALPYAKEIKSFSFKEERVEIKGNFNFKKNEIYPLSLTNFRKEIKVKDFTLKVVEKGFFRNIPYIKVVYNPFHFNGKNLSYTKRVDLEIVLKDSRTTYLKSGIDLSFVDLYSSTFYNFNDVFDTYPVLKTTGEQVDYLIINATGLEKTLERYIEYRTSQGFNVKLVSINEVRSAFPASDLAESIRNYLKEHYLEWGLKYLLLVGSMNDVPMAYAYPEPNERRDEDSKTRFVGRTPTDFYYAELTSNWDADKDNLRGESEEDTKEMDFMPEIFVGRWPFSDSTAVDKLINSTINYESSSDNFKKNALLPAAMLYFAEEKRDDGTNYSRSDGATDIDYIWREFLKPSGFSRVSMYEKAGLKASIYDCDFPLTEANFISELKKGVYGFVDWSAHGNTNGVARKIWKSDSNNDGVAQNNEIEWPSMITIDSLSGVLLNFPIVYSGSCQTAWPEKENLAKTMLKNGAVAYIGASRISWGGGGVDPLNKAVVEGYSSNYTLAESLNLAQSKLGGFFIWDLTNLYDYNLYGDPILSLNPTNFLNLNFEQKILSIPQGGTMNLNINLQVKDPFELPIMLEFQTTEKLITGSFDKDTINDLTSKNVLLKIKVDGNLPEGVYYVKVISKSKNLNFTSFIIINVTPYTFSKFDLNKDKAIDGQDLLILAQSFGSKKGDPHYNSSADFNNDDKVDGQDLLMFAQVFGTNP